MIGRVNRATSLLENQIEHHPEFLAARYSPLPSDYSLADTIIVSILAVAMLGLMYYLNRQRK